MRHDEKSVLPPAMIEIGDAMAHDDLKAFSKYLLNEALLAEGDYP